MLSKAVLLWKMVPLACATVLAAGVVVLAPSARATPITFNQCVTDNNAGDCAIAFDQISLDVTSGGGNKVLFDFANTGSEMLTLARIYFDDGSLMELLSISNGGGVNFTFDPFPGPNDLPGGQNALDVFGNPDPFVTTLGFLSGATAPPPTNGLEPGENVVLTFKLNGGQNIDDIIAELGDGTLRVGVHMINFASGGSESLITLVPEPSTGLLVGLGLAALALGRRRGNR